MLVKGNELQGLFIFTEEMKLSMKLWPEILLIDGTYKLVNTGQTLMILAIEDSVGTTQIVAMCLLASEDKDSLTWFLEEFRKKKFGSL